MVAMVQSRLLLLAIVLLEKTNSYELPHPGTYSYGQYCHKQNIS